MAMEFVFVECRGAGLTDRWPLYFASLGSNQVTFPDVATMGLFTEGSPPEFNCMNEYYGMAFEWGEAVATPVYGTLNTTGKVSFGL